MCSSDLIEDALAYLNDRRDEMVQDLDACARRSALSTVDTLLSERPEAGGPSVRHRLTEVEIGRASCRERV